LQLVTSVSFWLDEICQSVVGGIGLMGNLVAIVVYLSAGSKFSTVFYRLLVALLLVQTCYIILVPILSKVFFGGSATPCASPPPRPSK
jgi:hypothetical protein